MLLGLLSQTQGEFYASNYRLIDEAAVQALIDRRLEARKMRNFAEADRIRDELAAMGVAIKDSKDAFGNPMTIWGPPR
jgi:cysteinyl-tRNA synthetase